MQSHRALASIFVTGLLDRIGFGIILPVMTKLIMDVTGESLAQAASLPQIPSSPGLNNAVMPSLSRSASIAASLGSSGSA
jgi:hypothetical protein